jgi:hypothetical protein
MKVTKPKMSTAFLSCSLTAKERNQRNAFVDTSLQVHTTERCKYTAWYCKHVIAYITMAANRNHLPIDCSENNRSCSGSKPSSWIEALVYAGCGDDGLLLPQSLRTHLQHHACSSKSKISTCHPEMRTALNSTSEVAESAASEATQEEGDSSSLNYSTRALSNPTRFSTSEREGLDE